MTQEQFEQLLAEQKRTNELLEKMLKQLNADSARAAIAQLAVA